MIFCIFAVASPKWAISFFEQDEIFNYIFTIN